MNVWRLLWNLSEKTGIGLGPCARFVFERMLGRKGRRQ